MRILLLPLLITATAGAVETTREWPRLVGQLLVGTAGVEPGVAAEWTYDWGHLVRLRPELFLNDRPLPGIAGSISWAVALDHLPVGHELFIGPRLAYHNNRRDDDNDRGRGNDDEVRYGFEAGALGLYVIPIVPSQPDRHCIEALLALGIIDHDDDLDPALTIGAAYGYQF